MAAGDPGEPHPAGLGGDQVDVAQHQGGDGDDQRGHVQPLQPEQQVAQRGGGGQGQRDQHAERALDQDVPGAEQARLGQRRPRATSIRGSGPVNGSSTASTTNGSSISARRSDPAGRDPGDGPHDGEQQPGSPANTPNASRGVATTHRPRRAAPRRSSPRPAAGAPATSPGRYSGWAWPAPTASCSVRPGPRRRAGARTRNSSPATTTRSPATPSTPASPVGALAAADGVVGERAAGHRGDRSAFWAMQVPSSCSPAAVSLTVQPCRVTESSPSGRGWRGRTGRRR